MTAEQLIKNIKDNNLQKSLFNDEYVDDITTEDLEKMGLLNYDEVESREDTSEFWKVLYFPDSDVYLKLTGEYDSYGQGDHYFDDEVKQVFPKKVETTIYV